MDKLLVSSSPHITSKLTTRKIMLHVIIALIPCVITGVLFFGLGAIVLIAVCAITAYLAELIYCYAFNAASNRKEKFGDIQANNLSSVVTGILLALNLPVGIVYNSSGELIFYNIWMPILGTVFAIIVVKMLFGGIGKNFLNPALMGRIFMFLAFSSYMMTSGTSNILGIDNITSATWLDSRDALTIKTDWFDMFFGNKSAAAIGETGIFAILLGYIYLSFTKIIDFKLPAIITLSSAVFAFLFDGVFNGGTFSDMMLITAGHLISGGLLFGAVFMATDYATSPNTRLGKIIFGVGIALLVVLMRVYGAYPEGMSFAIVIMNIFTPIIDKYIYPKPFGYCKTKKGGK